MKTALSAGDSCRVSALCMSAWQVMSWHACKESCMVTYPSFVGMAERQRIARSYPPPSLAASSSVDRYGNHEYQCRASINQLETML